jgi:hypothetical protein
MVDRDETGAKVSQKLTLDLIAAINFSGRLLTCKLPWLRCDALVAWPRLLAILGLPLELAFLE